MYCPAYPQNRWIRHIEEHTSSKGDNIAISLAGLLVIVEEGVLIIIVKQLEFLGKANA